jgi:hypothetical protein
MSRRRDGSVRDKFVDMPCTALIDRMSEDSKAHNERTRLKAGYRELVRENPELFE